MNTPELGPETRHNTINGMNGQLARIADRVATIGEFGPPLRPSETDYFRQLEGDNFDYNVVEDGYGNNFVRLGTGNDQMIGLERLSEDGNDRTSITCTNETLKHVVQRSAVRNVLNINQETETPELVNVARSAAALVLWRTYQDAKKDIYM